MTSAQVNLTRGQREALALMIHCERVGVPVRESNHTLSRDRWTQLGANDPVHSGERGLPVSVYWQPLRWLVENGYASEPDPVSRRTKLTNAGCALADRSGL